MANNVMENLKKESGEILKSYGKSQRQTTRNASLSKVFSFMFIILIFGKGASKGGSFDSDINKHDDTLVKN